MNSILFLLPVSFAVIHSIFDRGASRVARCAQVSRAWDLNLRILEFEIARLSFIREFMYPETHNTKFSFYTSVISTFVHTRESTHFGFRNLLVSGDNFRNAGKRR